MKTILLVAHGSRHKSSNEEIFQLGKKMQDLIADNSKVVVAFLELAKPDIANGIDQCASLGACEITIIPYFLSAGRHVVEDVPNAVASAKEKYPHIKITISNHFGSHSDIAKLLIADKN